MFRSLRLRIALSQGLVLALIVLILGGTAYLLLARSLDRSATADVLSAARAQADRIAETGRVMPAADNDVPSAAAVRVAVGLPDGTIMDEPRGGPTWLRPHRAQVATIQVLGEDVRIATVPAVSNGRHIATVVA